MLNSMMASPPPAPTTTPSTPTRSPSNSTTKCSSSKYASDYVGSLLAELHDDGDHRSRVPIVRPAGLVHHKQPEDSGLDSGGGVAEIAETKGEEPVGDVEEEESLVK